ncbi:hypothetical protein ES332_D07G258900v1 [Gossypium tomentosum]|uniref:Uncharacterized protein n=1 Tax=Gossypium tomentosum TaxID=34277 RepID=A0A5D2KBS2_GOSTO|nr:hypothetical protein ES332_D07G258900v1 [Gossypium tomentosum]
MDRAVHFESIREPAEEKFEAKNGDADRSFSLGAIKEKTLTLQTITTKFADMVAIQPFFVVSIE